MITKVTCISDPTHDRFITTAHVVQEWIVDSKGNFLEVMDDCLEVIHEPDPENLWTCTICGADANVEAG